MATSSKAAVAAKVAPAAAAATDGGGGKKKDSSSHPSKKQDMTPTKKTKGTTDNNDSNQQQQAEAPPKGKSSSSSAAAKKAKAKREVIGDAALDDFLQAYANKAVSDAPPPPPPRPKKKPFYTCRKCLGCAEVDIEVAIIEGRANVVRATVARLARTRPFELNQYYQDGTTPLILSLKERREDVCDAVLGSAQVRLDLKDQKTGLYPLHMAVLYGMGQALRRMLERSSQADVEAKDGRDMTPIMLAALVGNDDFFMALVQKGANIRLVDKEGFNLLSCAGYGGNVRICRWLLEAGFDRGYVDHRRQTAYDWAMANGKGEAAALIADWREDNNNNNNKK